MPEIPPLPGKKFPSRPAFIALGLGLAIALLVGQNLKLQSNLKSTTRITQNLRDELDGLRKQNDSFKKTEISGQSRIEDLSAQINTLRQGESLSSGRKGELKRLVTDAEKALSAQNARIADLETKLKEAEEKMERQKKASASLEKQTRSARSSPGMTQEYVKIVENEWLAAVEKTEELRKDLDRTLSELSGQNQERSKLRSETATMHYNLAVILTEQQNYPAAVLEYKKVLETRPADADAHYNLAVLYDDYVKDNDKALEHYRHYIQLAPESPEANKVRRWIQDKEYDTTMKFKL
jgi:tetratricopeptide (TPR) repeat protein